MRFTRPAAGTESPFLKEFTVPESSSDRLLSHPSEDTMLAVSMLSAVAGCDWEEAEGHLLRLVADRGQPEVVEGLIDAAGSLLLAYGGLDEPICLSCLQDRLTRSWLIGTEDYPALRALIEVACSRAAGFRVPFEVPPILEPHLLRAGYALLSWMWSEYEDLVTKSVDAALAAGDVVAVSRRYLRDLTRQTR